MFTLFYRNTRLLILTIILIFVWGVSSYFTLPRLEDPELISRNALVKTFFPGADAERVEVLVTEKIEDKLTEIEEIDNYQSTSRAGSSIINIELNDNINKQEVDLVWSRVRNKIDEVKNELPNNISEPELEEVKVKAYALIAGLTWQQDNEPNYTILRRQAEVFKERLELISGTEEVEIFGDPDEEIVVEINPKALASYNLTVRELSQQIAQSDSKIAAGQLRSEDNNLLIEVAGELDTLARIRQIPIQFGSESQFVALKDIATIRKGISEPAIELALIDGYPGIALAVHVESGQRLDLWAETAQEKIAEFQSELPNSIGLPIIFNQSNYVEARLNNLILNLLFGAVLVFGVTVVMMGWRSALIVGSALPISVLMVFGWMNWLNIPLHQMSITGLIVALGILIDNAIVMVDEVSRKLKDRETRGQGRLGDKGVLKDTPSDNKETRETRGQGDKGVLTLKGTASHKDTPSDNRETREIRKNYVICKNAIINSIKTLAIPLLSSTLTTILAFLPIALLPGSTGEFVGTIAITVIVAVACSLFISLTIIPTLAVRLHRYRKVGIVHPTGIFIPLLNRFYQRTIRWTVTKPLLSISLALLLPIIGFIQVSNLEQQFFPAADRDQLQIELELSPSVSLYQTETVATQIRQQITKYPEVKEVHWLLGRSIPSFYYNLTGGKNQQANYAQALVSLNSLADTDITSKLQTELDRAFPSARIIVRQLEQGPPFDAPIEMRIYGSNLANLQSLGEKVRQTLVQIPEVTHTRASLDEIQPQLQLQIDEEQARLAGLDRLTIAQQLDNTLEGAVGGSVIEDSEELPVRVRLKNRSNLSQISDLDLLPNSPNNPSTTVPLSALGKVQIKPELAQITHYNGQRVNLIQGFLEAGVLPAEILSQFQTQLKNNNFVFPPGYSFEFGGESEQRNDAVGGLIATVGVIAVVMIATLVLSLGSFKLAGIIGIVAVASGGLGIFSVWLFGYPFGFNPIIGTVGLIGVAVNDSIVVLSAISNHPIAKTGNPKAIQAVVLHSTRHVLTTTLTTAIGFVPLLLSGSEFWQPLAIAIAGGVIGATLIALYFVPSAYYLLKSASRKNRFSIEKSEVRIVQPR